MKNSDKKRKHEEPLFSSQIPPATQTTIVNGSLDVRGNVRAYSFTQFSDLRLKTDIEDIVDAIKIVTSLQGKTYRWRNGEENGNRVIGLIAQEVQKVLPEVQKKKKHFPFCYLILIFFLGCSRR